MKLLPDGGIGGFGLPIGVGNLGGSSGPNTRPRSGSVEELLERLGLLIPSQATPNPTPPPSGGAVVVPNTNGGGNTYVIPIAVPQPASPAPATPTPPPPSARSRYVSALTALQTGVSILGGLASLRNSLGGGTTSPAGGLMAGASIITAGTQLAALPLPGGASPGFRTGGTLNQAALQGGMVPSGYHYAKDGSGRIVRNRRMNPLNASAARRAIRRIKGARKMLQSIERSLPKRKAATPARRR